MKHIGRYRLDRIHGSGAFATVWQGFDTELEITVAVKVLAENWAHQVDVRERFLEEARLLRRLSSDRVVRVYDVGTHEGQPFFVMDFATGGTLADRVDGSLTPDRALDLAAQSARSVQVLHDAGVIHRDIKPSNLLVDIDRDGHERVVVADLGSAKRLAEASGITVTTGTPSYMAPEQALGRGIDERSDIYALGVVTYVLLTGTLPYDISDPIALITRKASDRPGRLPAEHREALNSVLARAMALEPDGRPRSAEELASALDAIAAGEGDIGAASGWPTRVIVALSAGLFVACGAVTWLVVR